MIEAYPDGTTGPSNVEALGIDPAWLPDLARHYAGERFVHLRGVLSADDAGELLETTRSVPSRRVSCGLEHVTWQERVFETDHPAYEFFERSQTAELVTVLAGLRERQGLTVWTSTYELGEYINPHRDSSGSIQLLVCLQAPPDPANGGVLVVAGNRIFLRPGDAVAFEATALEHSTTPLVATAQAPESQRAMLIGRYFLV